MARKNTPPEYGLSPFNNILSALSVCLQDQNFITSLNARLSGMLSSTDLENYGRCGEGSTYGSHNRCLPVELEL